MNKTNLKHPNVAIVGCLHGDEIIGKLTINKLVKLTLEQGSITGIIGNPKALARKKRFISTDLNRSFPGKSKGVSETRRAFELTKLLRPYDLCLDIHATNSNFESLIIVTKLTKNIKAILKLLPIKKVALMQSADFKKGTMLNHVKLGIALEYGPNKSGKNHLHAVSDLKQLFVNLKMINGSLKQYPHKILYRVFGAYNVDSKFNQSPRLRDFHSPSITGNRLLSRITSDHCSAKLRKPQTCDS